MEPQALEGIVAALVTPFREDERIDYDAWHVVIDTLSVAGVNGFSVAGGQGEFFSLTHEERVVALRFCAQTIRGRKPLYANVGCVTTRETVKLAHAAESLGADCLVVVTPYYLNPSASELAEHYVEVCRSVHIPVLANNNPDRTGVDLTPEIVAQIAFRCDNFAGLKDSSGDLKRIGAYRKVADGRPFAVFTGADDNLLPALEAGASGIFSACANVAPRLMIYLYEAWLRGDRGQAARLQGLAEQLHRTLSLHTFPGVIKEAMQMAGMPAGPCRKPVGLMPSAAREKLVPVLQLLKREGYLPGAARGAGM